MLKAYRASTQKSELERRSKGLLGTAPDIPTPASMLYPRTGRPGEELPPGWNAIPGARGCTPEACGFRDAHSQFAELGVRLLALSTQSADYQREMAGRLHLPFPVLSDEALVFTRALGLPTFETSGWTLLKRLTLVVDDGRIAHVFYPVFPPDSHAAAVLDWLRS